MLPSGITPGVRSHCVGATKHVAARQPAAPRARLRPTLRRLSLAAICLTASLLAPAWQPPCSAQLPEREADPPALEWEEELAEDLGDLPEDRPGLIVWPPAPGEPGYVPPKSDVPPAFTQPLGDVDDQASIEHARGALSRGWGSRFPWYDESNDDVKPLRIPPPPKPRSWNVPRWSFNLPGSALSRVAWIVLVVLVIALAWLLWRAYLAREARQAATQPETQRRIVSDASRIEALPFAIRRTATDLLGEAERCYLEGNYSEAVIYFYSYLLVALDRGQIVRLAKGKTNRQYLRELGGRPRLREILTLVMVAFEDVFFGQQPLSQHRFEQCWALRHEFHSHLQGAAA